MRIIDLHCYPGTAEWIRCQGPYVEALAKYWKREWVARSEEEVIRDFTDSEMPLEVRRLGRTIRRWRTQIVAWHRSHVSNGPTEAINNLVKRVKRVAFGLTNWTNYRTRALLYAGRPNWSLLTP